MFFLHQILGSGGGSEIRTHVGVASPTVFKTGPFSRSGIPPFGGGGGIRTHASLAAQGFSKPSQWTSYATPPRYILC